MTAPRQRKPAAAPVDYPPGHFTELMRAHGFPPRFEPQFQRTREAVQSEISRINRERRQALGDTGTIVGLSQRADKLIAQRLHSPTPKPWNAR